MKKLLTATLAIAMSATLVGALAACKKGPSDADTAEKAITTVRGMYHNDAKETSGSYTVIGQTKANNKTCKIAWTVSPAESCTLNNFGDYVSVGEMDEDNMVTINISKATVEIEYILKASVTVGKATQSAEFKHSVPKSLATDPEETDVTIDFTGGTNRKVFTSDQQVWEQDGVTLTNDKGASTTKVDNASSSYHIRIYKSSSVKIEYPGMVKLIFHSEAAYTGSDGKTSDYPAYLKSSLEEKNFGTVTADTENNTVTLELASPMDVLEFTASAGQIRLTSLDIIAKKSGTSDEDKANGALAQITLDQTNYTATGTYDLPANKGGLDIDWSLAAASDYASVVSGKLNVTTMPEAETPITLVASVTSGSVTKTKNITVKLVPLALDHAGTEADPYSIADAKTVIATLTPGSTTTEDYYVKGYVIAPGTYAGSQYNNFDDMYIADSADATKEDASAILVYRPKAEGEYLTSEGFNKGDLVTFKGKLQNYKGNDDSLTPEIANGAICVAKEAAQRTDAQIVADAKESLTLSKTTFSTAGETFELPATKSGATISWAVTTTTTHVTIDGTTMTIVSLPTTSTTITITATITSNSANDTKPFDITVEPLTLTGAGTQASPYTAADVIAIAKGMTAGSYTAEQVFVKGYVVDPGTYSSQHSNFTGVYIVDEYAAEKNKDSEGALQVYGLQGGGLSQTNILAKGDFVLVQGYIQNRSGKAQITYSNNNNPTLIEWQKAGMSDEDAVAAAKAAVTLATSYEAGEVTLPLSSNGATLSWSVTAGDSIVSIDNATGKMTITAPAVQTTVSVRVDITKGSASDYKTFDFNVLASSTKGTEADPYTVAEIDAIISDLENNKYYQVGGANKLVYVQGYIVKVGTEGTYGREKIEIADSADATSGLLIYGNNYDGELARGMVPEVGDKVMVIGYVKKNVYNGTTTNEFANSGNERPVIKFVKAETKLARAAALVGDTLDNITKVGDTNLPASPVNGVTFEWELSETVAGVTVAGGKITVEALPAEDTPVTLQFTAKLAGTTDVQKPVTVTIEAAPEPDEETELYTLGFTADDIKNDASVNSYTTSYDAVRGDITWTLTSFNNNQKGWNYIKCGRKPPKSGSGASIATITTKNAVEKVITKVDVAIDSVTATYVNSFKLLIADDADFTNAAEVSVDIATGTKTFNVPQNAQGANKYYRIVIDCAEGTANGFVQLSKVVLWGFNG